MAEMNDELKKLFEEVASGKKSVDEATSSVKKMNDALKDQDKGLKGLLKAQKDYSSAISGELKLLAEGRKKAKDIADAYQEIVEALDDVTDSTFYHEKNTVNAQKNILGAYQRTTDQIQKQKKDTLELQRSGKILDPASIINIQNLEDAKDLLEDIKKAADRIDDDDWGAGLVKNLKTASILKNKFVDSYRNKDPRGIKQVGNTMSQLGEAKGGVIGGVLKGIGGVTSKIGGPLAIASRALEAGKAVVDTIDTLDKTYKLATQEYQSLAGAQLDGEAFVREAHEYNQAIREVGRNTELGMASKDWNSMFQAMGNAGLTIKGVSDRMGNMDDVMRTVRSSSLALGVDATSGGELMTTMFMEMRVGLDDMQEGLLEVARQARETGIESTRFLQTVQASTLVMANYGNFMDTAAKSLTSFTKASISQTSADDLAKKSTAGLGELSVQQRLSVIEMGNGSESFLDKVYQEIVKKEEERTKALKDGNRETANKLGTELSQMRAILASDSDRGTKAATIAPFVEGAMNDLIADMMKKVSGKSNVVDAVSTGDAEFWMNKIPGLDPQYLLDIRGALHSNQTQLNDGLNTISSFIKDTKASETTLDNDAFMSVINTLKKGDEATSEDKLFVEEAFRAMGLEGLSLENLMTQVELNPKVFASEFSKAMSTNDFKGFSVKGFSESLFRGAATSERFGKEQLKGQEAQIDSVTELAKLYGITKESAIYDLSANNISKGILYASNAIMEGVNNIYSYISRGDVGDATVAIKDFDTLKRKLDVLSKENIARVANTEDKSSGIKKMRETLEEFFRAKSQKRLILKKFDEQISSKANDVSFDFEGEMKKFLKDTNYFNKPLESVLGKKLEKQRDIVKDRYDDLDKDELGVLSKHDHRRLEQILSGGGTPMKIPTSTPSLEMSNIQKKQLSHLKGNTPTLTPLEQDSFGAGSFSKGWGSTIKNTTINNTNTFNGVQDMSRAHRYMEMNK